MRARLPTLVVLAALLAAAVVAGNATQSAPAQPAQPATAAAVTRGAGSVVWFCPGPPTALPAAAARLTLANLADASADAVVTVLPDDGAPVRRTITLDGSSVQTFPRADFGPPGAVTIEGFGGNVVAEEGLDGQNASESTTCATQAAAHWYFAGGTTPRGVDEWLVIEDPLASDAKVDITIRTGDGPRRPDDLQAVDIASRSRVLIPIHQYAVREQRVAIEVDARVGEVVAAETLVFGTDAGTPGVASTIGAPSAGDHVQFAAGATRTLEQAWLALANVGSNDAHVTVQAVTTSNDSVAPALVTLAPDDVVWVQLGGCVGGAGTSCLSIPDGERFALDVRSDRGAPIAAQVLERPGARGVSGAMTSVGTRVPARAWELARVRLADDTATELAIFDPTAQPARVDVELRHDGSVDRPPDMQGLAVGAGRVVVVRITESASVHDAAITVSSSAPVIVERTVLGLGDSARSLAAAVGP